MKILVLDTPEFLAVQQRPSLKHSLHLVLCKKTIAGFSIMDGSAWLLIHIALSVMIAQNFLKGYLIMENGASQLLFSVFRSAALHALLIYPFWQLFFVRWKCRELFSTIGYQLVAGALYALIVSVAYELTDSWARHSFFETETVFPFFIGSLLTYYVHQLLFTAYHFWRQFQACLAQETKLKKAVEQHEMTALKTQIEPHFLFNTLNSISASVPPSQENTRVLIAQLADTFRYALRVNENQFVPLADELEFMKTWLALEEQRFGKRLQVVYKIEDECYQHNVPPMLLQPIIENALKHGISPKQEGGQVTIECFLKEDALAVSVSDTGVGFDGKLNEIFERGIGLQNSQRRLQLLFNETITVERGEKGLRFSFRIPFQPSPSLL